MDQKKSPQIILRQAQEVRGKFFKRFRWLRNLIIGLLVFFASYALGRFSHMYFGSLNTPHHWIYGVVALVAGLIFFRKKWGAYLILFGLGFILSDFQDMLNLEFYGVDTVMMKVFWGIN